MARIPDEQVARLKTEVSIVRLVEAAGIELNKHGGSDRVGRCPFLRTWTSIVWSASPGVLCLSDQRAFPPSIPV